MELTDEHKDSLLVLKTELVVPKFSTKVRLSQMIYLMDAGFVNLKFIKIDDFWVLTDLGREYVKNINI